MNYHKIIVKIRIISFVEKKSSGSQLHFLKPFHSKSCHSMNLTALVEKSFRKSVDLKQGFFVFYLFLNSYYVII